ncbi:MAG: amino acid permease, partial [Winkia neuii]|uniref:amino acid permease n=1 Tax=Winkia neuii TaxID=33007 RepID=UPI0029068781
GLGGILIAACMAVFSFGGIENVSVGAAESEHPERDIPRAAGAMIWRLLIFYVLAVTVVVALQNWQDTAAHTGSVSESPFVKVLDASGVPAAGHIINAILIVAALSAANGCLYSCSRMIHSLALDKMAPNFARFTSRHGAPRGAVLIATVGMVIASVLAIVAPNSAFLYLYGCATVSILVTWVMVMLTHLRFRRDTTHKEKPPACLVGYPVVNYLIIAISVAIFILLYWELPVVWYAGIPYLIILVASYYLLARSRKLPDPAPLTTMDQKRAE